MFEWRPTLEYTLAEDTFGTLAEDMFGTFEETERKGQTAGFVFVRLVWRVKYIKDNWQRLGWRFLVSRRDIRRRCRVCRRWKFPRIIIPFEGYTGRYVWHCHILEHEDNEMMRPYEVIARK